RPGPAAAEMDVDEFLVEANGAGVREALRVILDLELKSPRLALIEEPEVHLHPGLERALEGYLREKSKEVQLFITTHSTNFIDAAALQNVYLVRRDAGNATVSEEVSLGDAVFRLSSELGLRLSSVFMFDRLIFVEGPSDEAVLRSVARTAGIELAKANVGFVHMGGVRNFAYYAADHTLELLSRRQVKMSFIVDRDEADDEEIARMVDRLGGRATLVVLSRRELENLLLDSDAIVALLKAKGLPSEKLPPASRVREELREVAEGLRDEVVRLRLERRVLTPVHLIRRGATGPARERLAQAIDNLRSRADNIDEVENDLRQEVDREWPARSLDLTPGALLLEKLFGRYGVSFSKTAGDSARLAALIARERLDRELTGILTDVVTGT
ncbi:MAG: AAA family ATPase, partial [Gemmatimonadales bacterium]|nr:AAA family ATPase [Gemmatimonadales bacterium]